MPLPSMEVEEVKEVEEIAPVKDQADFNERVEANLGEVWEITWEIISAILNWLKLVMFICMLQV